MPQLRHSSLTTSRQAPKNLGTVSIMTSRNSYCTQVPAVLRVLYYGSEIGPEFPIWYCWLGRDGAQPPLIKTSSSRAAIAGLLALNEGDCPTYRVIFRTLSSLLRPSTMEGLTGSSPGGFQLYTGSSVAPLRSSLWPSNLWKE